MAKTATKPRATTQAPPQEATSKGQVAVIQPPRIAYPPEVHEEFGIDAASWRALVEAVFPSAKTVEGVVLALAYCRGRNLDPMKKPIHIVPIWNSTLHKEVETIWSGIGEHRISAHRTGAYAGSDQTAFGADVTETFTDRVKGKDNRGNETWTDQSITVTYPEWAQVTVYRIVAGTRCSFPGPIVEWRSFYGKKKWTTLPTEKWATAPRYMLEKCAEAAALRKAFPEETGELPIAEEMGGWHDPAEEMRDVTPVPEPTREDVAPTGKEPDEGKRADALKDTTRAERASDAKKTQADQRAKSPEKSNESERAERSEQTDSKERTADGIAVIDEVGEVLHDGLDNKAFITQFQTEFDKVVRGGKIETITQFWENNEDALRVVHQAGYAATVKGLFVKYQKLIAPPAEPDPPSNVGDDEPPPNLGDAEPPGVPAEITKDEIATTVEAPHELPTSTDATDPWRWHDFRDQFLGFIARCASVPEIDAWWQANVRSIQRLQQEDAKTYGAVNSATVGARAKLQQPGEAAK